jgi:hypothetical protein
MHTEHLPGIHMQGPIWRSIQWLDQEGIKAIETVDG